MSLVTYRRGFVMMGVVVKAVVVKHSKAKVVKQERRKRFKEGAAMATTKLLSTNEICFHLNLWMLCFLVFGSYSYIERIVDSDLKHQGFLFRIGRCFSCFYVQRSV